MQATPSPDVRPWKRLYTAALFEIDSSKLPERIAQAEAALIVRARELFHAAGDNIEEEEAVDDAMYAAAGTAEYLSLSSSSPCGWTQPRGGLISL